MAEGSPEVGGTKETTADLSALYSDASLQVTIQKVGKKVETFRSKMATPNAKALGAAFFYGSCSTFMPFTNKLVMNTYGFNYPFFMMCCQMMFIMASLEILRLTKVLDLPAFTLERGKSFMWPSVFYAVHSVLALTALSGMNIPMYAVLKRCAPVAIMLLGVPLLNKGFPSRMVIIAVSMVTLGCVIAGYGDLAFDLNAYIFGIAAVLTQALYMICVQKFTSSNQTALETLHLNSFNSLPLLLLFSMLLGEFKPALLNFNFADPGFLVVFTIMMLVGSMLNYSSFLCTTLNCALTTGIVGVMKSVVQSVIGAFTFGGISFNLYTICGITTNMTGGFFYVYAKYLDGKNKPFQGTCNVPQKVGSINLESKKIVENGNPKMNV